MFTMFASLAAALLSQAAPATVDTAAASTSSAVTAPLATPAAKSAKNKLYCIVDTPTGTRVAQRSCHTRSEWAGLGVDLDAN